MGEMVKIERYRVKQKRVKRFGLIGMRLNCKGPNGTGSNVTGSIGTVLNDSESNVSGLNGMRSSSTGSNGTEPKKYSLELFGVSVTGSNGPGPNGLEPNVIGGWG